MSITIRFLRERGDLRWRAIECVLVLLILGEDGSSTSMAQEFRPADGEVIGAFPCNPSMIFNPSNGQK